ncbi:MAG: PilZ domain-containing protein [Syntrophaceae bacterium]|nr:PilZ domain-containing protein [Syntrophaceae bacterium]
MNKTIKKIYADENGLVLFVCPKCGEVQKGQAQIYKDQNAKWPVKIHCECGNNYNVIVEKRKFPRKETRLDGTYSTTSNPEKWEKMIVKNLSTQGCGYEMLNPNWLNANEEIRIEFKLDDNKSSPIRKRALVHFVYKNYVSCKFIEQPGGGDPELESYMRNV